MFEFLTQVMQRAMIDATINERLLPLAGKKFEVCVLGELLRKLYWSILLGLSF